MTMQTEYPNDQLEHAILSAWLDVSSTGMCVVDDTSRVVMLNHAACNMLGVNALEVLDRPIKALFDAVKGAPSLIQWLGVPGFDGEKHVTKTEKNGTVDLSLRATTLRAYSAAGIVEQFKVISIADITPLKTAQRMIESGALKNQRNQAALQPVNGIEGSH
jgi:PAS domain S-box-containing protein